MWKGKMEPETLGPNSLEIKKLENNCAAHSGSVGWGKEAKVRPRRAAEEVERLRHSAPPGNPAAPAAADRQNDPVAGRAALRSAVLPTGGGAAQGGWRPSAAAALAHGPAIPGGSAGLLRASGRRRKEERPLLLFRKKR